MIANRAFTLKNIAAFVFVSSIMVSVFQIYKYTRRNEKYKPTSDFFKKLHIHRQLDQKQTFLMNDADKDSGQPVLNTLLALQKSDTLQKAIGQLNQGQLDMSHKNGRQSHDLSGHANDQLPNALGQATNLNQNHREPSGDASKIDIEDKDDNLEPAPLSGNVHQNDISKDGSKANVPEKEKDLSKKEFPKNEFPKNEFAKSEPKGDACVVGRNKARENEWLARDVKTSQQTSQVDQERAEQVKKMMTHAWFGYRRYAWGANELAPEIKRPHDGVFHGTRMGLTIVDSLDTLWIMGMFEEVERGKQWLVNNLTAATNVNVEVSVFEFNIRYVGGLLGMYALTNECEYKQLAVMCAEKLVPSFNTIHGIPVSHVNLKHGHDTQYGSNGASVLSEIGTLHLEFFYLSKITGDSKYRKLVENVREKLVKARIDGLYSNQFYQMDASFSKNDMVVSLGGAGDSFYEYLFKSYLQTGRSDVRAKDLYFDAMQAIIKAGLLKTSPSGLKYFGKLGSYHGQVHSSMEHLTCFVGGMIGLSAEFSKNSSATLNLAEELAKTCHESYIRSGSGIGPESFGFSQGREAIASGDRSYHLRPEVVESWYFLQRLTHKSMYKEWSWTFIQALERYCKVDTGYTGLHDVNRVTRQPQREDIQQSFFLAETLKYLYLIYKDDELMPLKDWVFTTEAHPLPVLHS